MNNIDNISPIRMHCSVFSATFYYNDSMTLYENVCVLYAKLNEVIENNNMIVSDLTELSTLLNNFIIYVNGMYKQDLTDEILLIVQGMFDDLESVDANMELIKARNDIFSLEFEFLKDRLANDTLNKKAAKNKIRSMNELFNYLRPITIDVFGDSIIYGSDEVNRVRPPASTPTDSGLIHVRNRAGISIPEAIQQSLNSVYGVTNIVTNKGYEGDTAKLGITHWNAPTTDVSIIMYGTNDGRALIYDEYFTYIRKHIERSLENDCHVILLSPPKTKAETSKSISVCVEICRILAIEYNIDYIDMQKLTTNFDSAYYSDDLHFNTDGYKYIGYKLATHLMGKTTSIKVGNTTSLQPLVETTGVYYTGTNVTQSTAYPTVGIVDNLKGYALTMTSSSVLNYFIETTEDNLVVAPCFYVTGTLTGSSIKLELDGNYNVALSNKMIQSNVWETSKRLLGSSTYTSADVNSPSPLRYGYSIYTDTDNTDIRLIIPKAGIHHIKITVTGTATFTFMSLDFVNLVSIKNCIDVVALKRNN